MDLSKLPLIRNDTLIWYDSSQMPGPGKIVPCLMCTKPFIMPKFVGEYDQICGECQKTFDESAKVVCKRCHATIGRVAPGLIDCGYLVRPHTTLHVNACNVCRPGILFSTVLEIEQWERVMRPRKIIIPSSVRAVT